MKLSDSFFYTVREDIKDEESISGNLLVRSGMIKKTSNGIYMYLPIGLRILSKIENIVREEMNKAGAMELLMPSLLPEEVYIASGRRDNFGSNMFSLKDRYQRDYVLGPTHEELFVMAASQKIKSYKDMPFNLYQIGKKYRDETRPRYGLIRVREFIMKDAYSFDVDLKGLDESYQKMFQAYKDIFDRLGLEYKIVTADTGAMGGLLSEEFQAISSIGEDILVLCKDCSYASNIEVSYMKEIAVESNDELLDYELLHTPNVGHIDDFVNLTGIPAERLVKTLIYKIDGEFYACLVQGHREVNELKLQKLLGAKEIEMAAFEDVERITNAKVGFAGPVGLSIPIIMDTDVQYMKNFVVGANKSDYHYTNVNIRDFECNLISDIKNVIEGDSCPECGGSLYFQKGIEVGNTFKLGTKYSESMDLYYLDNENKLKPVVMGCYGIGIERIMAAMVEQFHDDKGIIWNREVAPYQVSIVLIDVNDDKQKEAAEKIYNELNDNNIEVLLDDRNLRAGVKFNDMDLIGIPVRITVGKNIENDLVEIKLREEDNSNLVSINNILDEIKKYL